VFVADRRSQPPVPIIKQVGRPPAQQSTAKIRHCPRHGRVEFHYVGRGGGQKAWRCKRCVGEAVTRRKQKIKRILVEEAGGRCLHCGYDRGILNLTFHHLERASKKFSMSMETGRSLAAFREEAKKCILLCANCHGEIEERARANAPLESRTRTTRGTRPVELRRCSAHGVTEFALYGRRTPKWTCKRCNVAANLRRRRAMRTTLIELAGGRCAICGYRESEAVLHFHHVDPETKLFDVKRGSARARAVVLAELAKCVLLCANCHGEIEAGLISCPPAGTRYADAVGGEAPATSALMPEVAAAG
jgi:cytochrome c553